VERLKEIFADPLLADDIGTPSELVEMAEAAPNASRAVARLHGAWREALERLSDLSHLMAERPELPQDAGARLPYARAAAYFEEASPWFADLEAAAAELSERLKPRDDPMGALKAHLREAFGVDTRILPSHVMPAEQARYDRHSSRLFISERAPLAERPFLLARQAALLGDRELIERLTADAGLDEPEAARLCRLGFARRLAEAVLAPAARLVEAAQSTGADPVRLGERFGLRPSRVMARLAAVGAGGVGLPPAFTILVDASGGQMSRMPGAGFPFPRFGPLCARLPLFDGVAPGRAVRAELTLPSGDAFFMIATAEDGTSPGDMLPPRRLAAIGWRREEAGEPARDRVSAAAQRPIGITCRLCERLDCAHRMHPPVTRPAALLDHVVGPSDYEVAG
jgi:predicted transcriptional regulator